MKLKTLDVFPKENVKYKKRPKSRFSDFSMYLFFMFLLYMDITTKLTKRLLYTYDVVQGIVDTFSINMSLIVMDSCDNLGIYIDDVSNDRLYVNELVEVQRIQSFDEDGRDWCKIEGQFSANRVRGRLSIVSPGSIFRGSFMNTSHIIREFSFGDFYPARIDPLDYTMKVFEEPTSIAYFLSIFPTKVRAMGLEVETNQYSVRQVSKDSVSLKQPPAIHFDYDFEPIQVHIRENRLSFFQWFCRMTNIIGGLYFTWKFFNKLFKRKYLQPRLEKGILD